jgi:Protein of unknown function (DUF3363)
MGDRRKCQTYAASPAEPGGLPVMLERARAAIDRLGGDPEAFVRSHVRRLEALRRAGHAERIDADHWHVPADLPERGQTYDLARDRANIRISSCLPSALTNRSATRERPGSTANLSPASGSCSPARGSARR